MPEFKPRDNQGILVGYRLQLGGKWARGYLVFPLSDFADYAFNTPRHLNELIPITTQEVILTGDISFPLKARYDARKRMLPDCTLRPAVYYEAGTLEENGDSNNPGGGEHARQWWRRRWRWCGWLRPGQPR